MLTDTKCWCEACRPVTMDDMRMVLCPTCGNKRCPHAADHRNQCTGSNEVGQVGSRYQHAARAIEAEVRSEAQEPIGEVTHDAGGRWGSLAKNLPIGTKLYTAPQAPCPKRIELEPVAYSWVSPSLERTMLGDIPPAPHIGARNVYALVRQYDAATIISGKDAEIERLRSKFDLLVIERDAQAVLISDQQAGVEKQTEISNNFAAQVRQQNATIAQQAERIAELEKDAERYQWMRSRDLDAIVEGGVFAGKVPDNIVLNGDDLDAAIDAAIAAQKGGAV